MGLAEEYTEEWIGYWSYLAHRTQSAMYRAVHEIQRRRYDSSDAISDIVSFWTDVGVATVTAWRGDAHKPPVVVLPLSTDDDIGGSETVALLSQSLPFVSPEVIWLGAVTSSEPDDAPSRSLTRENLQAWPDRDRRELEIKLVGTGPAQQAATTAPADQPIKPTKQKRQPLRAATYRAIVRIGQVPVAEVLVVVERPQRLSPRRRRGRRRQP